MANRWRARLRWPDATRRPLPWLGIAALAFAAQQIGVHALGTEGPESIFRRAIFLLGTIALIGMAVAFRRFLGAWLVAAGIALNAIPMAAHGGLMPVAYETVRQADWIGPVTEAHIGHEFPGGKDIVLRRADIRFEPLVDRYDLTAPVVGPNIYSIGDFVLFAGIGLAILQAGWVLASPLRRDRADIAPNPPAHAHDPVAPPDPD